MTAGNSPHRFEGKRLRRAVLTLVTLPPFAAVGAATVGLISLDASIALAVASVLAILTILVDFVLETSASERRTLISYKNDDEAIPILARYVVTNRPREADLLEYSGLGAMGLLASLGEAASTTRVRLLLAHPETALSDYQREVRLAEGLRTLAYRVPVAEATKCGLQVRCYREPASIRMRRVGDVIVMGWYTYDDRGLPDPSRSQMSGGTNASIGGHVGEATVAHVHGLGSRVFENVWREATPAGDAWEPFMGALLQLPNKDWFDAVRG